jgi:hypothetical protein
MIFPNKGTVGYAIGRALLGCGSTSVDTMMEGIAKFTRVAVVRRLRELAAMDCVVLTVLDGGIPSYRNTAPLEKYFYEAVYGAPHGASAEIVRPATPPPFKPMKLSGAGTALGTREGSNDYRAWPSRHSSRET